MPHYLKYAFAGIILGLLIGVPWTYAVWHNRQYRNFHVVEDGVLYRSGQLPLEGLKRIIHDYAIKTVVTLRYAPSPDKPAPDQDEEDMCRAAGLHYFRLKYQAWTGPDCDAGECGVPAEVNIRQFLDIMKDPRNHPVLVHCFAGVHRTGAMCAIYRMEFDRWAPARALSEMRDLGYWANHRDVFNYLENYQPMGCSAGKTGARRHGMPVSPPENISPVNNADPGNSPKPPDESMRGIPRPIRARLFNPPTRLISYQARPGDTVHVDISPNNSGIGRDAQVQPDGTVCLNAVGSIHVAGKSHGQIADVIGQHLEKAGIAGKVAVDVFPSTNPGPFYHVILTGHAAGERVFRQPWTAGKTVRDFLGTTAGGPGPRDRVWIVRQAGSADEPGQVLAADCHALASGQVTAVNYPILPGDQVHVHTADPTHIPSTTQGRLKNPLYRDVPDQADVLRALAPASGIPPLHDESRSNFEFTFEKVHASADEHFQHILWKCTVSYTLHARSWFPFPFHAANRREQIVYVERDVLMAKE